MTPYYQQDGITIYHGDCRDVLPTLAAGAATAVVADPPFGIGFDYGTYDDAAEGYANLMRTWLAEASRIVGDGPCFVWQAVLTADRWHQWFPPGFRIFAACKGFVQFRPQPVQHSWDPVVFWGQLRGEPSVYRKDWHVQYLAPFGAGRPKINHPCPRPLEQVRYVVTLAADRGDTILDPFMGSGTTLRAAKDCGCQAIGIEIEERYCEIAAKRLSQGVLFGADEVRGPAA
jgi:site-specific DNA-methyltransferase (adenine-specific)